MTAISRGNAASLDSLKDAVLALQEGNVNGGYVPVFNVKTQYGAKGDGATDDRSAIQSAIDACAAAGGGVVYLPAGTYMVGSSGQTIAGRAYGLLLKTGVALVGASVYASTIKMVSQANIDLVNTYRTGGQSGIALQSLTLDGNDANQSASNGFNLWAYGITDLDIRDLRSINASSWTARIDTCARVRINDYEAVSAADINADGLHFVDTSQVTGSNIYIYTEGDDGFVIEALGQNVSDYALSGIYVQPKHTSVSAGLRGVLLLGDQSVMTGARTISDVNLAAVVVKNAFGAAVSCDGASYRNVHISSVSDACGGDLYLSPGNATYAGSMWNCSFEVVGANSTSSSINILTNYGAYRGNKLDATISNPPDAAAAVLVRGSYWSGRIEVDYDPSATKVSPQQGIVIYDTFNDFEISCRDANQNVFLQGTAANNTFRVGYLTGGKLQDLRIAAGASNNSFDGNHLGAVSDSGTATRFGLFGVAGALPTADPHVPGQLWSNAGTITVSAG